MSVLCRGDVHDSCVFNPAQVSIAKVLLGVFGAAVVVVLIAVPTVMFLKEEQGGDGSQRSFTLEDVFNSSLKPKSYSLSWISDHEYLHKSQGSVLLHDVVKEQSTEFLSRETFNEKDAYDYHLSADRRYVAFVSNHSKIWRHSFTASYSLFDRELNKFLTPSDIPDEVQFFDWAPEGNKLAFVWKNDVYVKTRPGSPPQQVTFDGEENQILNGIPDWVYEEEMFSSNQGLWWSPGGKYVAYAQFNDTQVHAIEYPWYGENQYPSTVSIPYPKPGTPNPVVKLFVVDTDNTTKITEVVVPASFGSSEHYLATVTWVTDNRIAVQWLKRVQNHLILQIYSFTGSSWDPAEHREVKSSTGWIGRFSPIEPVIAADKNSYYLLMSDASGYKHIHHVAGGTATPITSGEWEVIDILKVTADRVYYSSNQEGGRPGGRNVYEWTKDGTKCLTCSIHKEKCQYNSAYFSHNASFYRMSCSGPGIPYHALMDNRNNTELKVLEDNIAFGNLIADVRMPTMRRDSLNLGGYKLWFQMFLPPGFDESKKYPLLIDVYAGPCSQKADFVYRVSWSTYLASTENIIVASFDGRGSGFQGDKLMHEIYKRLGTYEVEDQITAAKEFIKFGFVDKDRVAIWGWSYGGYVTSMALGSGSGVFKCGMAVAPVSKWEYYDSIYTERYMMEPSENADAYTNSTVTARAQNFHPVQYLLVHGTADDNVHFQQGAEISEALVEEQVDFEAMWYTDKDHGLGGSAYQHVYTHMSHFLQRCFA
ncbi:putative dipeptidyl peptidase 4 [Scophthalmus maximus]|uniref:Putative dipeptidyl peptidase 4 n=1 Tax=Scophthalmus maximus TaxID=52904 RepID=A0A2U9AV21_SCOMX|nr:dipeptidyl peptidase 4 isoform X1 [Scophthalmus maximus]AWO95559.1 putative dipeptidyl peptidase 4 [Scophthalmus maximus]